MSINRKLMKRMLFSLIALCLKALGKEKITITELFFNFAFMKLWKKQYFIHP